MAQIHPLIRGRWKKGHDWRQKLKTEPQPERIVHFLHLGRRQCTEPAHQLRSGDGLHLLEVKGAGLEEWLWHPEFPAMGAQRGGVQEHGEQVGLIVRRFSGEQQRAAPGRLENPVLANRAATVRFRAHSFP